jgi:hypothetical protein
VALNFEQAGELLRSCKPVRYSLGGLLVLGGTTFSFLLAPSHAHPEVLAAMADLPAGTVLTAADLHEVQSAVPGAEAAPAAAENSYLGKTLRFGLAKGALLAPGDTGAFPPPGFMTVSLLLHPGQYPQDLAAGQKVGILPLSADGSSAFTPQTAAGSAASGPAPAVVAGQLLSLTPTDGAQDGVVAELLVPASSAGQVAAAPSAALLGMDGAGA